MKRMMIIAGGLLILGASVAFSDGGFRNIRERLSGYQEFPVISSQGRGEFRAKINAEGTEISYRLSYEALEGSILQSHIHFGPPNNTGNISVFLCSNLGNGPKGTQACPLPPATISGVITAVDVIGPTGQGIAPGQLDELLAAMRQGKTYVNIHSSLWPGGEIRAQIPGDEGHDDH